MSMKLSVCVVTYNQENYIKQCLDSILEQETTFEFEIIIGDDCSTDLTSQIVQQYSDQYPNKIKYFRHEKNIGAFKNFVFVHEQAVGDLVAHIDGDDYMLPSKLQRQVEFLETDLNCCILWHNVFRLKNGTLKQLEYETPIEKIKVIKRQHIIQYEGIGCQSSKMYRKSLIKIVEHPGFPTLDFFYNVEQIGEGYAVLLKGEPLGVYREEVGIWSNQNTRDLYYDTLHYFLLKYPKHRPEINSVFFLHLLLSVVKRSTNAKKLLKYWAKSIHVFGFILFFQTNYRRLPKFASKLLVRS